MTLFSLTWNTSGRTTLSAALDAGETHVFYGSKPAVYTLAFNLKSQGFTFIIVRDALGRIVDTSAALQDIADINPTALLGTNK
jgi:hypothetical protein